MKKLRTLTYLFLFLISLLVVGCGDDDKGGDIAEESIRFATEQTDLPLLNGRTLKITSVVIR